MKVGEKRLTKKGRFWLRVAFAPTVITVAVALFSPQDILDRIPLLSQLLIIWAPLIPALHGYVDYSAFPQVTGAFLALAWTLFPVQIVAWLFVMHHVGDPKRLASAARATKTSRLRVITVCIIGLLLLAAGLGFLPKDPGFSGVFGMSRSRLGLAFFGSSMFLFFCVVFSMLLGVLRNTRRKDF